MSARHTPEDPTCGATFRGIGSDFINCAKWKHDGWLHVGLKPDGSSFWWSAAGPASPAEVAAELATGAKGTYTDDPATPTPTPTPTSATVVPPAAVACRGNPSSGSSSDARVRAQLRQQSIESGFTGDACGECGAMKLTRNGSCMKCHGCGATTGCS